MLELLAKRLDEAGVSHFTLQGSTPKPVRAEQVRRFNQGEADVFLISLRAGGTGLNLTAADIVIHYDPTVEPCRAESGHRPRLPYRSAQPGAGVPADRAGHH